MREGGRKGRSVGGILFSEMLILTVIRCKKTTLILINLKNYFYVGLK